MTGKTPFIISGTGCALVDYLYKPVDFIDPGFKKYLSVKPGDGGLAPGKLVFTEEFEKFSGEAYLKAREKITRGMKPVAVNIGGPSIVSLIHAAQLLHDQPAEVKFYGCRGSDEGGTFIDTMLKKTPLKTGKYKTGNHFTPFTDVLSDPEFDHGNGERIFINNIGAAWDFTPTDLDDSFFQADMVVFGGTALVPNIHFSLGGLVKKAKELGKITVVNTVFDFLSEKNDPSKPWLLGDSADTYKHIDLLITDMEESLRLSGTRSVEDAVRFFKSSGVGSLIITHGSNDLHFFADNELFGHVASSEMPVSERVKTELKGAAGREGDTTGCGDNFTGGVIASIAGQLIANPHSRVSFREAIAMGVASGGFSCFYYGGTYYEQNPGEKKNLVHSYYRSFLLQTGLTAGDR